MGNKGREIETRWVVILVIGFAIIVYGIVSFLIWGEEKGKSRGNQKEEYREIDFTGLRGGDLYEEVLLVFYENQDQNIGTYVKILGKKLTLHNWDTGKSYTYLIFESTDRDGEIGYIYVEYNGTFEEFYIPDESILKIEGKIAKYAERNAEGIYEVYYYIDSEKIEVVVEGDVEIEY
jgi:hypothetical protein